MLIKEKENPEEVGGSGFQGGIAPTPTSEHRGHGFQKIR